MTDIEIAQKAEMKRISPLVADKLGIADEHLEPYGHYKAKLSLDYIDSLQEKAEGKLILVTAISPTPAGEGNEGWSCWWWLCAGSANGGY